MIPPKTPSLVAALPPADSVHLEDLHAAFGLEALLWPNQDQSPRFPLYANAGALLADRKPDACVFVYPYRNLQADALALLEAGVAVYSPGPIGLNAGQIEHLQHSPHPLRLASGGAFRSDPGHVALMEQRQKPAFGEPVFLRAFCGGGVSFHALWWGLYDLLERALDLAKTQPRSAYVAVNRRGQAHQAVLHASFDHGMQAQLTVGPAGASHPIDTLFLGSGGLLSLPLSGNQALLLDESGQRLCATTPHHLVNWLRQALHAENTPQPDPLGRTLLLAMRQALHEKEPRLIGL